MKNQKLLAIIAFILVNLGVYISHWFYTIPLVTLFILKTLVLLPSIYKDLSKKLSNE